MTNAGKKKLSKIQNKYDVKQNKILNPSTFGTVRKYNKLVKATNKKLYASKEYADIKKRAQKFMDKLSSKGISEMEYVSMHPNGGKEYNKILSDNEKLAKKFLYETYKEKYGKRPTNI